MRGRLGPEHKHIDKLVAAAQRASSVRQQTLYPMFMGQCARGRSALTVIAWRIRALGFPAAASYREYAKLTSFKEVEGAMEADTTARPAA